MIIQSIEELTHFACESSARKPYLNELNVGCVFSFDVPLTKKSICVIWVWVFYIIIKCEWNSLVFIQWIIEFIKSPLSFV